MYFRMLLDDASGEVSYLLADLDAAEAVLIDPRGDDLPVLQAMLAEHGLRLRWLLRTHEHDAQRPGERGALEALGAPLVQHRPPATQQGCIAIGHQHLRALATPGHTAGCLSYLWHDRLFCGGLLALEGCPWQPRPALPEALWDSAVQQVFTLPVETLLFSGHARRARAVSCVLEQRRWHPWFAGASRDEFLARVRAPMPGAGPVRAVADGACEASAVPPEILNAVH
jgi:glyoxylase-like metal-dependent hydrolase (beta-lactamase superfamily II)